MKDTREVRPGGVLYADDLNAVDAEVRRLGRVDVEGGTGTVEAGGQLIAVDTGRQAFWARLVLRVGSVYSWEEVTPVKGGGWRTDATARRGHYATEAAREANGTAAAAGTVVWLEEGESYLDPAGTRAYSSWTFLHCCGGVYSGSGASG